MGSRCGKSSISSRPHAMLAPLVRVSSHASTACALPTFATCRYGYAPSGHTRSHETSEVKLRGAWAVQRARELHARVHAFVQSECCSVRRPAALNPAAGCACCLVWHACQWRAEAAMWPRLEPQYMGPGKAWWLCMVWCMTGRQCKLRSAGAAQKLSWSYREMQGRGHAWSRTEALMVV